MIYWFFLLIAGLIEVLWAYYLQKSQGSFLNVNFLLYLVAMAFSIYTTAFANRAIPMHIVYPILIGVGSVGTFLVSIAIFGEQFNATKLYSVLLIFSGVTLLHIEA